MNMMDIPTIQDGGGPPPPPSNMFDPMLLVRRVMRGAPIIVVAAILGVVAAAAVLPKITPRFTSSVSILIDPKRPGSYGADTEFANIYIDSSKVSSIEVVLESSGLLGKVVDKLHLAEDPEFGDAHPSALAPVLALITGRPVSMPADTPEARKGRAIDRLRRMITSARVGTTYVIKLDVSAPHPVMARTIANTVADAYIADLTDTKVEAASRDSAWLTDRLNAQRTDLIKSEVAVEDLRHKFGVVGSDTTPDSTTDRQSVTEINRELVAAENDVATAESKYGTASGVLSSGSRSGSLPDTAESKVLQELRGQQAQATIHLSDLTARYAPGYPAVKQAQMDLDAINRAVSSESSRVLGGLKSDYQTAVSRRDALKRQMTALVAAVNASSNAEGRVELREAERVAEANRIAYEASLNHLREIQEQQSRLDTEARIISPAELPDLPSSPKPSIILAGGGALGLVLGSGFVMLLPIGRRKVGNAIAAERQFLLPVLAKIPLMRRKDLLLGNRKLTIPEYLTLNPFSGFADNLRILRFRLRSVTARDNQVIQVTSAIPGEGKSTIAASLAISAASSHARCVLLDLDLHRPSAGNILGYTSDKGVVDILSGTATSASAMVVHHALPITIINAGSINKLHPGMIESKTLRELIDTLRREFDIVVIDTPPVLSISDPVYISNLVDATLLVVAANETPQDLVNDALVALRSAHAPLAGILLNKVSSGKMYGYYGNRGGYDRVKRLEAAPNAGA
jgi:capsular exopolysaccharide synthesis family protein